MSRILNGRYEVIPVTESGGVATEVEIRDTKTGIPVSFDATLPEGESEVFDVSEPGSLEAVKDLLRLAESKSDK